ncbi:MAG: tRNA (adenosine(37)-N6)-dimethylallyltransferase MiaA [Bdellovibrio sp.]|nr:tRNA (adenosine(37)-N6)-dimethylallyltransferase MiaA [Bdellovibrio sp.]
MVSEKNIVILSGPTATGKSSLAIELCKKYKNIEIINADSLLVYREFNIGTAKPNLKQLGEVKHHLIDIVEPSVSFTAADFVSRVNHTIKELNSINLRALIVGGSGFYLKALLYGLWQAPPGNLEIRKKFEPLTNSELYKQLLHLDSKKALQIKQNDRYRLIRALEILELTGQKPSQLKPKLQNNSQFKLWIIDRPDKDLFYHIEKRIDTMLQSGFIEEVISLRKTYPPTIFPLQSIGYKQVCDYLDKKKPKGRKVPDDIYGLKSEIILATRQLVKKQRTWFKSQKKDFCFELDRDLPELEKEFENIYGTSA